MIEHQATNNLPLLNFHDNRKHLNLIVPAISNVGSSLSFNNTFTSWPDSHPAILISPWECNIYPLTVDTLINTKRMIQYLVNSPVRKIEPNIYSCLDNSPKACYDKKARIYEFLVGNFFYNRVMWGTRPSDYIHYAREVLATCEGTVVDIGCGGLVQTSKLYASRLQYTILTDISLEMLRIGKHRLLQHKGKLPEHLTFLQADAFRLPFLDGAVDNVVSFGMLHLFDNKQAFIQEFLRVLKKGGSFHISALTNDRRFSKGYIRLLQRKNEFATAMSSRAIIELLQGYSHRIQHYTIGSMVFISGIK